MREADELKDPTEDYYAQPLEDNLFEWHFTVRGPVDTEFEGGVYHGRIILPPEYPMKPPSIILLTPNGRFEVHKKICLSISGHHPESWRPSWSIRTALLAIIGFMPTPGNGAIGSLDFTPEERKVLAKKSLEWGCPQCGDIKPLVLQLSGKPSSTNLEAQDIVKQMTLESEADKANSSEFPESSTDLASPEVPPETEQQPSSDNTAPPAPLGNKPSEEELRSETRRLGNELRERFAANRQRIAARIETVMAANSGTQINIGATPATSSVTNNSDSTPSRNSTSISNVASYTAICFLSLGIALLLIRRLFFI